MREHAIMEETFSVRYVVGLYNEELEFTPYSKVSV
jgi:hypothetical protein